MDLIHQDGRTSAIHSKGAFAGALRTATTNASDPPSWEALSTTATIVMTPDGSPIRTIVTGRRPITTGTYASRKAGRPQPYESMIERAFFMHSEVDTAVIDYRAQPFRMEFVIEGRKRVYIVDCMRLLADGAIQIVEVKRNRRALGDRDYALKLDAVGSVCDEVGWRFRLVLRSELEEPKHVYENIVDVQSWRFTAFSQADEFIVCEALRYRSAISLGSLGEALGDRLLGIAKLKAMVAKRIVRIDLSQPLGLEAPVELVADWPERMR